MFDTLLVAAVVHAAGIAARPPAAFPSHIVTVESRNINVCDPLLLKVEVSNATGNDVTIPAGYGPRYATVQLYLKRPGAQQADRVRVPDEGSWCGKSLPHTLKPGDSRCDYATVFWDREADRPVFSAPGLYQLTAKCNTAKGWVESPPVEIDVKPCAAGACDIITAARSDLALATGLLGYTSAETIRDLKQAADKVGRSNFTSHARRAILLNSLHTAGIPRLREPVWEDVQLYRRDLSPVAREFLDLQLALILIEQRELGRARAVLAGTPANSDLHQGIASKLLPPR